MRSSTLFRVFSKAATVITAVAAVTLLAAAQNAQADQISPVALAIYEGDSYVGPFSAANGLLVSVELNYPGNQQAVLRARATDEDLWEDFLFERLGYVSTYCARYAIYSLANYKHVSTERNYSGDQNGILRARAGSAQEWEKYTLCTDSTLGYFRIGASNGRFVAAELNWTGNQNAILRARTPIDKPGPWEMFY